VGSGLELTVDIKKVVKYLLDLLGSNQESEVTDLTTQMKISIRRKQKFASVVEYLHNISQACKIHGVSRPAFYDIRKTYERAWFSEGLRDEERSEAMC